MKQTAVTTYGKIYTFGLIQRIEKHDRIQTVDVKGQLPWDPAYKKVHLKERDTKSFEKISVYKKILSLNEFD